MTHEAPPSSFQARLLQPEKPGADRDWAFIVLPQEVSAQLPRRGRVTVAGTLNGEPFQVVLEPDGKKGHWLKIDSALLRASATAPGDLAEFRIAPLASEPEPEVPDDLLEALQTSPSAWANWQATTPVARLDWVHWLDSAKQVKTRTKRIEDACSMLASGKKRVCCFDTSGFYSKAFAAPKAID